MIEGALLIIAVNLICILLLAVRYRLIIRNLKSDISVFQSFYILLVSQFSIYIMPFKVGVILTKPLITNQCASVPLNKAFSATFFEQMFEIVWQLLLLILLVILFAQARVDYGNLWVSAGIIIAVFTGITFFFIKRERVIKFLWKFRNLMPKAVRTLGRKWNLSESKIKEMLNESIGYLSNWRFLIKYLLPTLMVVFCSPLFIAISARVFSVAISYSQSFLIYWISMVVGRISGLPGGFGARDLTMEGIMLSFGIDAAAGAQIIIFYRIVSMMPHFLIGGPLFFYFSKKIAAQQLSKAKSKKTAA